MNIIRFENNFSLGYKVKEQYSQIEIWLLEVIRLILRNILSVIMKDRFYRITGINMNFFNYFLRLRKNCATLHMTCTRNITNTKVFEIEIACL